MVRSIAVLAIAFIVHVLGDSNDTNLENESVVLYSPHIDPFSNKSIVYLHGLGKNNVTLPELKPSDERGLSLSAAGLSPSLLAKIPASWKKLNADGELIIEIPDNLGATVAVGNNNFDKPVVQTPPQPPQPPQPPPTPPPFLPDVPDLAKGTCGQTIHDPLSDARIVGGNEASKGSIPWLVRLEVSAGKDEIGRSMIALCGGTLLRVNDKVEATDIVITAAHCYNPKTGMTIRGSKAIAGNHNRRQGTPEDQRVDFDKFISHEEYNLDGRKKNDIAIIKLAKPIKFGKIVQPACLPKADEKVPEGTEALVAGWGHTSQGGQASMVLLQTKVPITSFQTCNNHYYNIVDKTQICAGYTQGGKDSCQGDSGGPLLVPTRQGYVLQGVVSVGDGCARRNTPGIYSRVSGYIDWINSKIKQYSDVAKQTA